MDKKTSDSMNDIVCHPNSPLWNDIVSDIVNEQMSGPSRTQDEFSMRFSTVYASAQAEMDEWNRIMHPDRYVK